ncbi:MAG: TatD family deoxyribonuclease [Chitinophagaceae bacterium]|nr:MAG: TatD family deoxyribonuclease [Chitinophagaceae bacterium]
MIDSHCHLYTEDFAQDIDIVIERAEAVGVQKFYLPAIDSSTHQPMIELAQKFPGKCFAMIGLHPCSVKEDYREELAIIENLLQQHSFTAIGETGLDFHWDTTFEKEQHIALKLQIGLALKHDLPLVLHTRNAMQQTINVVKEYRGTSLKGIFHCFGGSLEEAKQIIDCNFLLGIGGVVTYKNAGLQKVLPHVDLQHIVLETDAPYLSPVPHRGKRNESSYLTEVVAKIAEVKNVSTEEVAAVTTANAEKLFGTAAGF